jgi:ribosome-associated protein
MIFAAAVCHHLPHHDPVHDCSSAGGRPLTPEDEEAGDASESTGRYSRSERKRQAEALQKLGVRLVDLRPAQLHALQLPADLVAAVEEVRRMGHGPALARQRQYIGRLMRELDPDLAERVLTAVTDPRDAKVRR